MFSKKNRLSKDSDIKQVFAQGRAFFNPLFTIRFLKQPKNSRFTVVVSTKVSKSAVVRNRLKRQIREFARLNLSKFVSGDYTVILKPQAAAQDKAVLLKRFSELVIKSKLANI